MVRRCAALLRFAVGRSWGAPGWAFGMGHARGVRPPSAEVEGDGAHGVKVTSLASRESDLLFQFLCYELHIFFMYSAKQSK